MSSTFLELRSRSLRYVGSRCYNEKNQLIPCPITRPELIAIAVAAGICVLLGLIWCILRCGCSCRGRRQNAATRYNRAADPEAQPIVHLPAYQQFESSSERLTPPEYKQSDRLSRGPYSYLEQPSTETLVEPARIYPAVHSYPRN
ncbi:hypothetical protein B0H12DRAFT_635541 [Mycena haematopus]|nr:hypothetical protein B0H12DRAFT_635541 [Mycena haematopus]